MKTSFKKFQFKMLAKRIGGDVGNKKGLIEELKRPQIYKTPSLLHLFGSFFRLGITAFGGPAMVAYIRRMAVDEKHWLDERTARDGVALCQTIPGATAMQVCAYVGLKTRGIAGAGVSFIGFGLPSFLFMMLLSAMYIQTQRLPQVIAAFNGLQAIVVALICNAMISFGKSYIKNWKNIFSTVVAAGMFWFKINPILVILFAGFLGWVFYEKQTVTRSNGLKEKTYSAKPLFFLLSITALGFASLYFVDRELFHLAVLMGRIDLFAFGGGFASVPIMFHEIVEVRSWLDASTFLNGIALGQITPGPIVITATFVGYLLYGVWGGIIATIAVFLPSFVILNVTVPYFDKLRSSAHFLRVITGILCSFVGLLLTVTGRFVLDIPWDFPRFLLTSGALVALLMKVNILWVVIIGTAISLIIL